MHSYMDTLRRWFTWSNPWGLFIYSYPIMSVTSIDCYMVFDRPLGPSSSNWVLGSLNLILLDRRQTLTFSTYACLQSPSLSLSMLMIYPSPTATSAAHNISLTHWAVSLLFMRWVPFHTSWGINWKSHPEGYFLSKSKYITDLLRRWHMEAARPISMPMATSFLSVSSDAVLPDATEYCSVVEALQYVTIVRCVP